MHDKFLETTPEKNFDVFSSYRIEFILLRNSVNHMKTVTVDGASFPFANF